MDIKQLRRAKLELIVAKVGLSTFAKIVKKPDSQIRDMIAGRKSFGEKITRQFEERYAPELGRGWFDDPEGSNLPVTDKCDLCGAHQIPQYDTHAAMGTGLILPDQPGVIQSWQVSKDWISKNVKGYQSVNGLCIVTGFGDSMRPLFNPGDPLLVDTSVTSVDFDGIYFFRVDNEGFIKRLQRIPGEGLRVLSENRERYEPWTIKEGMNFQVLGRVLKVWCSEDF